MNLFKLKFSKFAASVAILTVVACVGVGGANLVKNYKVIDDNKYHNIISNQDLNENDIKNLASDVSNDANAEGRAIEIKPTSYTFNSIQEAEKTLDMKVVTPQDMPELELSELSGSTADFGNGTKTSTIWATYGSVETKCFGITITKTILGLESSPIVSSGEIDEGSSAKYKSSKGYEFNTFNESDENKTKTANIATLSVGNYEYSLVFFNFKQDEINKVLDSVDLSLYE